MMEQVQAGGSGGHLGLAGMRLKSIDAVLRAVVGTGSHSRLPDEVAGRERGEYTWESARPSVCCNACGFNRGRW